ncbi:MAG: Dyp-type peroxidase [Propionibacteriales bacterium]|nr:Dyp-type peroxidase [Propionibacteriales bacterium]
MTRKTPPSGIALAPGTRPLPAFRLVLLDAAAEASPASVRLAVGRVLAMLAELPSGHVRELEGQSSEMIEHTATQFAGLEVLLGYGRRAFDTDLHPPGLLEAPRPDYLAYLHLKDPFPALPWSAGVGTNSGETDFAVQLTAQHPAGVNCAAVEIWKLIVDEKLPLRVVASFDGFGRPDGRGWLEFHDGVSNLPADQRAEAVTATGDPPWMAGGTYLAFLRIELDLAAWRRLDREAQELVVGRDKRSGARIAEVTRGRDGRPRPVPSASSGSSAQDRLDWIDPPQGTDELLEMSHVHRANQNRSSASAPGGWRMFRQGYDFLADLGPDGPVLGLNFVSFQRDLSVLQHVLHLPGWLGDVNFGGPPPDACSAGESPQFLSLQAGGLYAVPAPAGPFPGADLFSECEWT